MGIFYELFYIFFSNIGVEKLARKFVILASQKNRHECQNELGLKFVKEEEYLKAAKWFTKSAELGNLYGQANLAWLYYEGKGMKQNFEKALYWYELASDQKHAESQYNLGYMYENGLGVCVDKLKALELYQQSLDNGCKLAKETLIEFKT